MVDQALKRVKDFIARHWDGHRPLLVGYSGGPDSRALLHALREAGVAPLHAAHVDHGWRAESAEEAELLQRDVETLGVVWHSTRLTERPARNVEDVARRSRLAFFQKLFTQTPFQALLLGHHRDDLAETALKRLLEGAHLPNLVGLAPITTLVGLPVWRPFLTLPKRALLEFLAARSLSHLTDSTNSDPRLLRTRLRHTLLPELSKTFGKEVAENLAQLSERAGELREYLERRTQSVWEAGLAAKSWDVQPLPERLEVRHLVQKALTHYGARASRQIVEAVVDALISRSPKCQFTVHGGHLATRAGVLRIW